MRICRVKPQYLVDCTHRSPIGSAVATPHTPSIGDRGPPTSRLTGICQPADSGDVVAPSCDFPVGDSLMSFRAITPATSGSGHRGARTGLIRRRRAGVRSARRRECSQGGLEQDRPAQRLSRLVPGLRRKPRRALCRPGRSQLHSPDRHRFRRVAAGRVPDQLSRRVLLCLRHLRECADRRLCRHGTRPRARDSGPGGRLRERRPGRGRADDVRQDQGTCHRRLLPEHNL